ncbi:condensation domain-containing protein, partial [Streptomyces sp. URMC 127]|uniref:condensation domain-containing protein n=1 Tax=Streptomyces sp. URMC 127 TaxID=3423402 RepID=UPI003F1C3BEE
APHPPAPQAAPPDWARYANDPLWREAAVTWLPEVEERLKEHLPAAMAPAAYVLVRDMPLTPNGKVDHAALTELLDEHDAGRRPAAGRPLTATERQVAGIWSELLGRDDIRAEDDFFALGGHSLLTFQLVFRLRKAFGVDMATRTPFEAPVLADLAARIDDLAGSRAGRTLPPLTPAGRGPAMPPSFAQERLWFLHQLDPAGTSYHVPLFVRLRGPLRTDLLAHALNEVVRRHEILRTVLVTHDGRPFQKILPHRPAGLPVTDLRTLPRQEAERRAEQLAREDHARPFDLARDPVLTARLLRLADEEHVLLVRTHHIAFDGWSTDVFLGEVAELYAAGTEQRAPALPALAVQYADYAAWERRLADEGHFDASRAYWRDRLDGVLDLPGLPLDRPRPARPTHRALALPFSLPRPVTDKIRAHCREADATLFMGLLTGAYALLHRRTGHTDLTVGADVANRSDTATEPLIGFFVNQVVLRADLTGAPDWRTLLRRVRAVTVDAYAHQELPYEQVVRMLNPRRGRNQNPLFQLKVGLGTTRRSAASLPGLTVTPFGAPADTARCDIFAHLTETPDGTVEGTWEYDAELFEADTMRELLDDYRTLLAAFAEHPGDPVAEAPTGHGPARTGD